MLHSIFFKVIKRVDFHIINFLFHLLHNITKYLHMIFYIKLLIEIIEIQEV